MINPRPIETPVYYDERVITTPKIVQKAKRSISLHDSRQQRAVHKKKLRKPLVANLTSQLQSQGSYPVRVTEESDKDDEDIVERVVADPSVPKVSRVRGDDRPITYLIDYPNEEPDHVLYKLRRPPRAVNRSLDQGYLLPANNTNTSKFLRPESRVQFHEPRLRDVITPNRPRLQKRMRGVKRRQRHGEIEKPNLKRT